jgi:DNA-binding response OmpR family regulator
MDAGLKILIVEDNEELRQTIAEVLDGEGHRVTAVDCAEAVSAQSGAVDLMLIDLNLPGEDGLSLARRMRAAQPDLGIIMMTARSLPYEIKLGYESGADIYLPKPFTLEELTAAIASLSRRRDPAADAEGIRLDPVRLVLHDGSGKQVPLSLGESSLLLAFARAGEQRLENRQLIELLNPDEARDPLAALELRIVQLRWILQLAGADSPSILSIRGWGYQLCPRMRIHPLPADAGQPHGMVSSLAN